MPHVSIAVEYGLHCMLFLVAPASGDRVASARELAELQGIPVEYAAKLFTKLQRAGLVAGLEGVRGGFKLAKRPDEISVLQVVTAIDGEKPLFECQGVRLRCAVFGSSPPTWASSGVCSIHAVMLEAEARVREVLGAHSLADLAARTAAKAPAEFSIEIDFWLGKRSAGRLGVRKPKSTGKGIQA